MTKGNENGSAAVRTYVVKSVLEDARKKGLRRFTVNAGAVHKALHLHNRVPQVCSALQSAKFLRENGLRIVEKTGPPSGFSTSVTITYEFADVPKPVPDDLDPFYALRGIGRELYAKYGGAEAYLRAEREGWEDEREGGSE